MYLKLIDALEKDFILLIGNDYNYFGGWWFLMRKSLK